MTDMTDDAPHPPDSLTGEVVSEPDTSGEWLPPAAAASRLGVSERTLWRHVNAGRYHKRVTAGRAEILVPGGTDTEPDNPATDTGLAVPDRSDAALLAVVAELKERRQQDAELIDRLTDRLTRQAEEVGQVKARLAQAEQRAVDAERRLRDRRWWNPRTW